MGCAVHSTLAVGVAYTTLEVKANFVRPLTVRHRPGAVHGNRRPRRADRAPPPRGGSWTATGRLYAHGTSTLLIRGGTERRALGAGLRCDAPVRSRGSIKSCVRWSPHARWSGSTSPKGVEARWQETWEAEGLYAAGAGGNAGQELRRLRTAAERHGQLHLGHALNGSIAGRARSLAPDAGRRHALAAGLRPRRDRDAERRREAAHRRRARTGTSSAARRSSSGPGSGSS